MAGIAGTCRSAAVRVYRRLVDGEPDNLQSVPPEQRVTVEFAGCIPDGDSLIVRTRSIVHDMPDGMSLLYETRDSKGNAIESHTTVLGRTFIADEDSESNGYWEVMASTRVSCHDVPVHVRVSDDAGVLAPGVRCLNRKRLRRMLADWKRVSTSAWDDPAYASWFRTHRADERELARQRSLASTDDPLVSIVVVDDAPGSLHDTVASVQSQSYEAWELVIVETGREDEGASGAIAALSDERVRVVNGGSGGDEATWAAAGIHAAQGELIAFVGCGDALEPDALHCCVSAMDAQNECDVVYCDEDSLTVGGRFVHPRFKPDFNLDLLRSCNYIGRFLVVRASIARGAGAVPGDVAGAVEYDRALRFSDAAREIVHVPRVLYHNRATATQDDAAKGTVAKVQQAGCHALEHHFTRCGIAADVVDGAEPLTYAVTYPVQGNPLVSIVIPSKDHIDVLSECIDSILESSAYPRFEVVIVENNSVDPATFAYYDEIIRDERVRVVTFEGAFNYSKVINFGVSQAHGEYLLLLNNDTKVISPDFIERMLGCCMRADVGVVGAKLLHLDQTVQHAGVVVGPFEEPWHVFLDAPDGYAGYLSRADLTQDYLAVTGACQMVERSIFDHAGGYDESFAIAYNDIDFCLKVVESGRCVVYDPHVRLYHREFTSRGRDVSSQAKMRSYAEKALLHYRWSRYFIAGDPYYNPNLERDSLFFALGR